MMMHPDEAFQIHIQRRNEMIRAARLQQLMDQAEADKARLPQRLLLILSDVMIGGGVRLKRYARRAAHPRPLAGAEAHLELVPKR
jgi:hypothetical protein